LWRELGYGDDILDAPWPEADAAALEQDEIELVLQVNGKKRGSIPCANNAAARVCGKARRAQPSRARNCSRQSRQKVIVVPGRLVNVVI
jgi:leucyl-tRNA synthetase